MIFQMLLSLSNMLTAWIFAGLPNMPGMPAEFTSYIDFIYNIATKSGAFLKYIYSPELLLAIYAMLLLLLTSKQVFMTLMFIIRKIPVLNIR